MKEGKRLWAFGDSFTQGYGCEYGFEYFHKYYKEGDRLWPDHLGALLGLEAINKGSSGASNDRILDIILNNYKDVKKGDTVIMSMTYPQRFDVEMSYKDGTALDTVTAMWPGIHKDTRLDSFDQEKRETLINFQYHFMQSPLIRLRWVARYKALEDIFREKGCRIVLWEVERDLKGIETIEEATSYEIDDGHLSFKGHLDFANSLYEVHFKPKTVI
jgi:hypothetical protein